MAQRLDSTVICLARLLVLFQCGRKIHHVKPRGTLLLKVLGHRDGIGRVHLHVRAVSALKADHLARDKIDRREDNHATSPPSPVWRVTNPCITRPATI